MSGWHFKPPKDEPSRLEKQNRVVRKVLRDNDEKRKHPWDAGVSEVLEKDYQGEVM